MSRFSAACDPDGDEFLGGVHAQIVRAAQRDVLRLCHFMRTGLKPLWEISSPRSAPMSVTIACKVATRSLGIALFQSLHSITQRRSIPASVRRAATSIACTASLAPAIRSLTVALNPSSRRSSAVWCWYCSHCFIDREVYLSRSLIGSANTGAVWLIRKATRPHAEMRISASRISMQRLAYSLMVQRGDSDPVAGPAPSFRKYPWKPDHRLRLYQVRWLPRGRDVPIARANHLTITRVPRGAGPPLQARGR